MESRHVRISILLLHPGARLSFGIISERSSLLVPRGCRYSGLGLVAHHRSMPIFSVPFTKSRVSLRKSSRRCSGCHLRLCGLCMLLSVLEPTSRRGCHSAKESTKDPSCGWLAWPCSPS